MVIQLQRSHSVVITVTVVTQLQWSHSFSGHTAAVVRVTQICSGHTVATVTQCSGHSCNGHTVTVVTHLQ